MRSEVFRYNIDQLLNLAKGLDKKYVVQVGIFGEKNPRGVAIVKRQGKMVSKYGAGESGLTNAELGAIHEFGSFSRKVPARSFLRMPISTKSDEIAKQASAGAKELIAAGQWMKVLQRLGIAAENAVQKAFAQHGFGKWAPDTDATRKRKRSSAPLIDTGQLRRSIASRVVPA